MSRRRRHDQHARIYNWERECDAYQSLSCKSRALLVEFRLLYNGRVNRIHMSVREAAKRLGVTEKTAKGALDELQDRGFIRLMVQGSFHNKLRLASVYALTNEPIEERDGATAPKDYMSWRKSTAADPPTNGGANSLCGSSDKVEERSNGGDRSHRCVPSEPSHGGLFSHTVKLPGGADARSEEDEAA